MKISYLREDLLSVTGGYKEALLLDYMLRACDYNEDNGVLMTLDAISEESQLWMSATAICKYMSELVGRGYIIEHGRKRFVNIRKLRKDLEHGGYKLIRV